MGPSAQSCRLDFYIDIDIPHWLDFLFFGKEGSSVDHSIDFSRSSDNNYENENDVMKLNRMVICGKTLKKNSGSHRTNFLGRYFGGEFYVSVLEKESLGCLPRGEIVYISAVDKSAQEQLKEWQQSGCVEEKVLNVLSAFIYSAVGCWPEFPENITETICTSHGCRGLNLSRFEIVVVDDHSKLQGQGCDLTEEASDCLVNRAAALIK